jgi:glycosyltransferase involved in cell wall biosynthesis
MSFPPIEGYHVASSRIIEAAARAGMNTQVITIEKNAKKIKHTKNWTVINSTINSRFLPSILLAIDDLLTSVSMASHVGFSDCNLVHVLNLTKETYVIIHSLLRIKKPLLVHFYHSPYVLADDVFFIRNLALRSGLYGRVLDNHVLTVNYSMYKFFIEKLHVDPERVHYAPYPVDTKVFKPLNDKEELRKKHHLPLDRFIVAYVGSLQPARGISNLVNSFRFVSDRFSEALLFISHPQRTEEKIYKKYLYEQIQNLRLGKNVIIRGPIPRIEEIYNLADVVVLPLIRPYWVDPPLVLLEAMSSDCAVITTPVGAINEVIQNYKNAILTKPRDPLILAEAITDLLENPRKLRKIAHEARNTIVQKYSYEVVGRILSKIYKFVLDHSN